MVVRTTMFEAMDLNDPLLNNDGNSIVRLEIHHGQLERISGDNRIAGPRAHTKHLQEI
jgi:hypothetical protein